MGVPGSLENEQKVIEGNLERIDLASVLQVLQNNGSEGTLEIRTESSEIRLFYGSQIGLTLSGGEELLGQSLLARLLHQDQLNHEQYDHVLCEAGTSGSTFVDVLHEMDILDEHVLVESLRECIEEEIYSLFFLKEATFEFHPVPFDVREHWGIATLDPLGVPVDRIVLEAARRIDEWAILRKKIPSLDLVYEADAERCQELGQPAPWKQRLVLSLVDDQRDLSEIVGLSGLSEFEVCRTVDHLAESGWIAPMSSADLKRHGEKFLRKNQLDLSVRFFELAAAGGGGGLELHELLALAEEARGNRDQAARHLLDASELRVTQGDVAAAFDDVSRAFELVPGDLVVAESKIEFFLTYAADHSLPTQGIVDEAIALTRKLASTDQIDKAVEILRRLDRLEDGNLRIKSEMIDSLLHRGLVTEAIAEYEKLGSFLVARGELDDARTIYKKILSLDHKRLDIADKLKRIERMRHDRRGRRRRMLVITGVLVAVALGGLGYSQYSKRAQSTIKSILERVGAGGASRETSIEELKRVSERFPLAPVVRSVDDEIRRIEVERNHEIVDATLRRKDRETEAADSLDVAVQHIDEGRLDQALIHIQQSIERAPDEQWIADNDLENQKARLLEYLEEAEDLYRRSQDAIRDEAWDVGFRLTKELLQDYPKSPFARNALLPMRIESRPAGAVVRVEGDEQEHVTPCAILVDTSRENRLSFSLAGHTPLVDRWIDTSRDTVRVVLHRQARWKFETEGPVVSTPAAVDGVLYIGSRDASVYALDPTESTVFWKRKVSALGDVETPLVEKDGMLYFGANDRRLYALDRESGEVRWHVEAAGFVKHRPLVEKSTAYFGCTKARVYAVDRIRGTIRWEASLGGRLISGVFRSGDLVAAGTMDGRVSFLSARTGALVREHDFGSGIVSLSASPQGVLVATTEDGRIVGLDENTGEHRWTVRAERSVLPAPTIDGGDVYIGGDDGVLRRIRIEDGELLASVRLGAPIRTPALVHEGAVYVGGEDRLLHCVGREELEPRWTGECDGAPRSAPFEAYGAIYVGCSDHRIYCFEP